MDNEKNGMGGQEFESSEDGFENSAENEIGTDNGTEQGEFELTDAEKKLLKVSPMRIGIIAIAFLGLLAFVIVGYGGRFATADDRVCNARRQAMLLEYYNSGAQYGTEGFAEFLETNYDLAESTCPDGEAYTFVEDNGTLSCSIHTGTIYPITTMISDGTMMRLIYESVFVHSSANEVPTPDDMGAVSLTSGAADSEEFSSSYFEMVGSEDFTRSEVDELIAFYDDEGKLDYVYCRIGSTERIYSSDGTLTNAHYSEIQ